MIEYDWYWLRLSYSKFGKGFTMLKEERFSRIIELVNERGSVKTIEISEDLNTSLATVRRDLNELDSLNKIKKVFGGASSIKNAQFVGIEEKLENKITKNIDQKNSIGAYAAALISDYDFVYMDTGTSVEAMIPYIDANNTSFVTNSISIANKLSARDFKVFILPGEFKSETGAIVGASTCDYLDGFNFSIGFLGANGIQEEVGFTTPDINEAMVKSRAISRCKKAYVLADSSKFGKIFQVSFSKDPDLEIITDSLGDDTKIYVRKYKEDKWYIP